MDVQNTFYLVGIIYMSLLILFVLLGIVVLLQVIFFIKSAPKKVGEMITNIIDENKGSLMGMAAMGVVSLIATKMKDMFRK